MGIHFLLTKKYSELIMPIYILIREGSPNYWIHLARQFSYHVSPCYGEACNMLSETEICIGITLDIYIILSCKLFLEQLLCARHCQVTLDIAVKKTA